MLFNILFVKNSVKASTRVFEYFAAPLCPGTFLQMFSAPLRCTFWSLTVFLMIFTGILASLYRNLQFSWGGKAAQLSSFKTASKFFNFYFFGNSFESSRRSWCSSISSWSSDPGSLTTVTLLILTLSLSSLALLNTKSLSTSSLSLNWPKKTSSSLSKSS